MMVAQKLPFLIHKLQFEIESEICLDFHIIGYGDANMEKAAVVG